MLHSTAAEIGQQIDPDLIARIEIARNFSDDMTQVRVFATNAGEPYLFEFENLGAAIQFYERLWSLRSAGHGNAAASHRA